ncbi:hypothetical protein ACMZ70_06535, partial [Gardnerella vaginalis]
KTNAKSFSRKCCLKPQNQQQNAESFPEFVADSRRVKLQKAQMLFAQSKRANVFAAQKQCFCLERLSAPNCLRTLRFKRSGRSSRPKTM